MTDRELMQQALEALTAYDGTNGESKRKRVLAALRERLAQPEMQPCAGRNCGSTNPNLHSAECFEDYEKSTGVVGQDCDCPYLNIHDAVVKDNDKALSLLSQCLDEMQYAGWNKPCADQQGRWNVFGAVLNYLHPSIKSDT